MKRKLRNLSSSKWLIISGSVLLYLVLMAVLLGLFLGEDEEEPEAVFGSLEGRFRSDISMEWQGETLYYRENEITNYLVIGVDKTDVNRVEGHQHGGQADFLVMLSIDRVHRTITPVMLDRDTMTEMQTYGVFGHPAGTRTMQLCLAQAYSGVNIPGSVNTVQTVSRLLHGVIIDHYLVMDMAAIPLINDAMGGVEVTLNDDFTMFDPAMKEGTTLRLMGDQAEFFVRGRMSVADGTNQSRMARQQQYLAGFLDQFRRNVQGDDSRLEEILAAAEGHVNSDAKQETLLRDINAYADYAWKPLVTPPGRHDVDQEGFAEFWVDETALQELTAEIWFHP